MAGTKYDDKFKANIQQHRSVRQILEKEGYEVNLQPIIPRTQGSIGSVFDCFKAARVDDSQQAIPAGLHDHGLTSWAEIIRSQRFLEYQVTNLAAYATRRLDHGLAVQPHIYILMPVWRPLSLRLEHLMLQKSL